MLNSRKKVVAVKYGAVVANTDVVYNTEGIQVQPKMQTGNYKSMDGGEGSKSTWRNDDSITCEGVTIKSYIEANDITGAALATVPSWTNVLRTCALKETIDVTTIGSEFIVYSPLDTVLSPASEVAIWTDGEKDLITGVVGNYKISGTVGEPVMHEVSYSGYTDLVPTADPNPAAAGVPSDTLILLKSTDTVTISGVAYKVQSFEFDQGNQTEDFYAIGLKQYDKVDFDATLSVTFYREDTVMFSAYKTGTKVPVVIQAGSVNGKSVKISALQAEIEEASRGTDKERETVTVKFSLQPTTGTAYDQYAIRYGFLA